MATAATKPLGEYLDGPKLVDIEYSADDDGTVWLTQHRENRPIIGEHSVAVRLPLEEVEAFIEMLKHIAYSERQYLHFKEVAVSDKEE